MNYLLVIKGFCGLKQFSGAWFARLTKVMINMGYKQSQGNHSLFIKHSVLGGVKILLAYVDDIIEIEDDKKEQQMLKSMSCHKI